MHEKKPKIIGIHGKKRAGKDTVADYLVETFGAKKYSFAQPLREGCAVMFGVPLEYFTNDDLKEEVLPHWDVTPRYILQQVGTEAMRHNFRDDMWVHRAKKEYALIRATVDDSKLEDMDMILSDVLVISDVRFENEVDWIESEGGTILHLNSKYAVGGDGHASEAGIRMRSGHTIIDNNESLASLFVQVEKYVQDFLRV